MATTKKTAAKKTPEKAPAPSFTIPAPVLDFQRRVLEGQRSLFERTFDAVTTAQERQEEVVNSRIAGSSVVPEPLKELASSWADSQRQIRATYRDAVVTNYELLDKWVDDLAKSA